MFTIGFFGKKQYAAIAAIVFMTKLWKARCRECSTCAMFFSSSLTVSIIALLRNKILSWIDISPPFMFALSFVTNCMPSKNSRQNNSLLMYPLSATSLP